MTSTGFELHGVGLQRAGTALLGGLTVQFSPHAHTAIIGPSGAGKSTLLRLLAGLDVPTEGQILLDGVVVSRPQEVVVAPHLRKVSMVFQDLALWPNLSAFDNVMLGLSGSRLSTAARRRCATAALEMVGIDGLGHRPPDTLSGGEQQRVALARALAPAPRHLFLDEPFASIDLPVKSRLLAEIARLAAQQSIAVFLVTHDPLEALGLCEEAVVLEGGRLSAQGRLKTLLASESPDSETLRAFRDQLCALQRI
jgi:ABC-type Fe3+/spermidine/putrescine transport system ATPase subunit